MLKGSAFTKTTLALVFSYSGTTSIFNEWNRIWYPTSKTPTDAILNRFGELDWPNFFVRVQLRSITEVNRNQLRYWVHLSLINRTFDLVRLVSLGKDENKTKALGKKYNFLVIIIIIFFNRYYSRTADFIRECCMSKITWETSYIYLYITFTMQLMFTDLTLNP